MEKGFYKTEFEMEQIAFPVFPDRLFNVENFKEKDKDYTAIQRAVDKCHENGGGIVIIPPGEWISGPVHLKSNINLKVEKNAVIRFSERFSDYLPVVFTRWEGMECYNYSPLIYAKDCTNIAVTGEGELIGNGEAWWGWKKLQQEAADLLCHAESCGIPVKDRIFGTTAQALRPSFIQPVNCENVLLEGFSIRNGPQWTLHPVYCENVVMRNINISTNGPNTDGINPDSCKNVLIEGCNLDTGDDCIAINSGMNEDGWRVNKPCENIVIRNCVMSGGHGGLVIGSGMSGGVRNVYAHNCKIKGTNQGIRLKSMRGRGGYVSNVWFENIHIDDVYQEAIQVNMYYGYSTVIPDSQKPSYFSNINIRNVSGKGAKTAVEICGLPERKLKSISLKNIHLTADNAMIFSEAEEIEMYNVKIEKMEKGS